MNSNADTSHDSPGGADILTVRLAHCNGRDVVALIDQGANPNGWIWVDENLQQTPLAAAVKRNDYLAVMDMLQALVKHPDVPVYRRHDVAADGSWNEQATLFDHLVARLSATNDGIKRQDESVVQDVKVFLMHNEIPIEWRVGIGEAFLRYVAARPLQVDGLNVDSLCQLLATASFRDPQGWNEVLNGTADRGQFINAIFEEEVLREHLLKIVDRAVVDGLDVDAISGHYFHLDDYYPMTVLQMAVLHDDRELVAKFIDLGADTTVRFPEDGGKTRDEWRGADLVALARLAERNSVLPMLEAVKAREAIMRTVAGVVEGAARREP